MSSFTTPLRFEEIDVQKWKILENFIFYRGSINDNDVYLVPRGFITDGASVPRQLWSIMPPVGAKYSKAAVIHDMLYATEMVTRAEADKIFLEAMKVLKVSKWKRWSMYLAVRAAGWRVWQKHDRAEVLRLRTWVESETIKYQQEML